jgi:uncharacterized protein YgfB (UPF0149 family)
MQAATLPTIETLGLILLQANADCTASELHGVITGLLASGARLNRVALMKNLEAHADPQQAFHDDVIAGLWLLQLSTLEDLSADELSFQPMLPEDDEPLSERVAALADFSRGFLAGFGIGVDAKHPFLAEATTRETLHDMSEIARVDCVDEADEEGEEAYTELCEFVRLAVIHLFDELAPREDHVHEATDSPSTLH